MSAVIICNGAIRDYSFYKKFIDKADFIICADGGAAHTRRFGIMPDILAGDFDSISKDDFDYFKNAGVEIVKFPEEKDMTDTELAVDIAVERGHKSILLLGGLGTRIDHSLSNVLILKKILDRGARGFIVDEDNEVTVIQDKIMLEREENVKVSLLSLSEKVEGVTTKGLYYRLDNATLEMGSSWGVSNEFTSGTAEVSIKKGLLLVIKSRDM